MADENTEIQEEQTQQEAQQTQSIQFEDILPWGSPGGDTGLSSRLKLKRNFDKIKTWIDVSDGRFLSKVHEDETRFLIKFFAGVFIDKLQQSPDFKFGEWTRDEEGVEHNDGIGYSIWKNIVDDWIIEIDYAIVRQLLRAKEFYTQTAHIEEVTNQTIFKVGLQTLGNILIGHYAEGVEGGIITPEGHVEINTLITRGLAKLQELFVVNNSTFGGNLSSIEFISAFLGGKGWAIQKKTRINAAGVEEEYYTLEIDNVTVRETLRVYEMIVSQLRGEFDNYVFAAMMEVHHYDPETGKVWLTTESGRIKAVPFKQGDYIKVQQYQAGNDVVSGGDGYITKSYELIITGSGTGGQTDDNGDRLDWVTFKNFTTSIKNGTPETVIEKKDTFVRIDNETDPERKGLMQIITVGPNTPYQDVYYGMKTDPNDALKLRTGNLQGIRTDLFGWLEGYGAYLPNVYAVGKFYNRQTGESLNSSIEITRERLKSVYTETIYNIQDEDNFLSNGFFAQDMAGWTKCACDGSAAPADITQEVVDSGNGTPLMVNGAVLAYQNRLTARITDYDGMKVLHLLGMGVYQDFDDIKANGTHKENVTDNEQSNDYTTTQDVPDTLYMGVRMIALSAGTLTVSFVRSNGETIASWNEQLNASREWTLVQARDSENYPWAYTGEEGRMIVSYTGECYIRFIALRTDPIVNSRENYSTLIEQNARHILLQAKKQTADLNEAVAEINIEFDNIRTTVTDNKDAADRAFANIISDLNDEITARQGLENTYHATWVYQNDHLLSLMAAEFNADGTIKGYADLKVQVNNISTTVTDNKDAADRAFANIISDLNDEITARQGLENTYHATWVYQNDHLLSLMAAEFNADGTIKGYADLKVQVNGISQTVTDNKAAADAAFRNLNETVIPGLESDIDDALDYGSAAATWINQNADRFSVISGKFDANGNPKFLSGYMQTTDFAGMFTTAMSNNGVITSGSISTYLTNYVDVDDVESIISVAEIKADNIKWEFTKTASWYSKSGYSSVKVMELDNQGNLWIKGQIASGSIISDGSNSYGTDSLLNQFRAYPITVRGASTYLYMTNGSVQAIIASQYNGEKNVYLPTLGSIRDALGIPYNDTRDFCVQLTIINQASMSGTTYDTDDLDIMGDSHDYTAQVTSTSARPRIMRGTDQTWVQLESKFIAIFFITYINRRFIANWIKG